jgi:hypothetical protein
MEHKNVDSNNPNEPTRKLKGRDLTISKIKLFGGAIAMLLLVVAIPLYGFPALEETEKVVKSDSNLKIYAINLSLASKMPDSVAKTDFIDYTTKAVVDKNITSEEKMVVEAKYATLLAENPEEANALEKLVFLKAVDEYKGDMIDVEELPDSSEKQDYLSYANEAIADNEITKREALGLEAKYKTLMSVQEYRQVTIKIKVQEWWQSKQP